MHQYIGCVKTSLHANKAKINDDLSTPESENLTRVTQN